MKSLTFEQYLNTTLRIAEFKDPRGFKVSPKSVLLGLLEQHLIPLIDSIDAAV